MYIHIFQLLPSLSFLQTFFPQGLETKNHPHPICLWIFQTAWACQGGYVALRHGAKQKCPQSSSHDGRCQWSLANPRSQQAWEKNIPNTCFTKRYTELVVVFAVANIYIYILGFKKCEVRNSKLLAWFQGEEFHHLAPWPQQKICWDLLFVPADLG